LFAERLAMLRHLLETGILNKEGTEYALQPRSRPELAAGWMAAVSPESFDLAAELGLDVMAGPFKPWPLVKADLARYRKRRPDGKTSFTLGVYCAEDHDAARRRAERGLVWAYRKILELTRPLMQGQLESYEHYRNLGWLTPLFDKVLNLSLLETMGLAAVGDPAHVGRKLTQLAESGLDRVSLVIGGGDLAASESVACVEMLGETVLPQIAGSAQTLKAVGI
jgi:alkanesulfonate monooxygenase SsuD/methylene tetrahydromethanopterin reductase-like flavin-dependent oxidoreductase (luciferase family)